MNNSKLNMENDKTQRINNEDIHHAKTSKSKKLLNSLKHIKLFIFNDNKLSKSEKKEYGTYFTIFAIITGSIWTAPWYRSLLFNEDFAFNFPGVINGATGLLICLPMYLRNFIEFKHISIFQCITFFLNWTLCSTISQLIIGPDNSSFNEILSFMLFSGILLTWLGIRSVAGFCWLYFIILAIGNLFFLSNLPQVTGLLFLVFGFFSLMFQMDISPAGLAKRFIIEFKNIDKQVINNIGEDISDAASSTASTVSEGVKFAAMAAGGMK
jgi:hypothetical protein